MRLGSGDRGDRKPSSRKLRKRKRDPFGDPLRRLVTTFQPEIGLLVENAPLGGQGTEGRGHFTATEQWTMIISTGSPSEYVDWHVEPDREAGVEQPCPSRWAREGAAAGGDDLRRQVQQAPDGFSLAVAEVAFAELIEDLSDAHPGRPLHFLVRVGERDAETAGEQPSDAGFAGTHQPDKGDGAVDLNSPVRHEAGAIQIALCWGKRPAMPRPKYDFGPQRRRRSPLPTILILLAVLIVGLLVYASTVDTEVPVGPIEQDVTNEVLAQ